MDHRHKCFHLNIVAYSLVFFQEVLNNAVCSLSDNYVSIVSISLPNTRSLKTTVSSNYSENFMRSFASTNLAMSR
jgi:hypothetical protein